MMEPINSLHMLSGPMFASALVIGAALVAIAAVVRPGRPVRVKVPRRSVGKRSVREV